nr:hypothetical protein [Tanacetum cinerariifolium]GFB09730.1 hypothetical protein [Tanacetum cinerariifolium]
SKKSGKPYDVLLQSLMAKFQWVLNQAKRLGLPPPPELATFGLNAEEKKKEKVRVPRGGLVIKEHESGIFFMNRNTDLAFQRENHLTPTVYLIRIQNQIKVYSDISNEMFRTMNYVIEARDDCIKGREIIEKTLDNLG